MKKSKERTHIEGVVFFDLSLNSDGRGWLVELFREDKLESKHFPSMGYISQTLPGVARGPHEHEEQSDLFCFIGPGDFELVLWEKRTFNPYDPYEERHVVGESNPVAVVVPPGVVHAYRNISDKPGLVFNFPNRLHGGPGSCYPVDEIRHESDVSSPYVI